MIKRMYQLVFSERWGESPESTESKLDGELVQMVLMQRENDKGYNEPMFLQKFE